MALPSSRLATAACAARAEIDDRPKPVELVVEGVCLTETGEVVSR